MKSIGSVLDENRGLGPGFDFLRLFLALAIFYGHTLWVAGGNSAPLIDAHAAKSTVVALTDGGGWTGIKRPLHVALVPMFFALSGFLVMGSAFRLRDVRTFLAFRGLRLFPALLVEVTLSALLLGAAVTSLPLSQYFSNPVFWRYFGNCIGEITFALPGVFQQNPVVGVVNVNLWTLPAEFACYAVTSALLVTGLLFQRRLLTTVFAIASIVLIALNGLTHFDVTPTVLATSTITYYFMVGVMFYVWKERIPANLWIFIVTGIASYALFMFHHFVYLAAPAVVYCTVYIGLLRIPKIPLASTGDYSYGIYLYGFPISQAVVFFVPWVHGRGWANVIISLILTAAFAAFSWHVVEKHALKLKKYLPERFFPKRVAILVTPTEVVSVAKARTA